MALAAYQFELRDGAWRLAGSQGIFALRGFSGTAALHAVVLSSRRQGLAVEYGSCWGGHCGAWLALYELKDGRVRREPAVELALSGINADSATDCQRRLQPLIKARLLAPAAIDQRQVLHYGDGKYRAVSGFDPVPPI